MARATVGAAAGIACLLAAGCFSFHSEPPRPGRTVAGTSPSIVQAHLVGNALIVESKWDSFGPYNFLVDTGSSVALEVSPELARRYPGKGPPPPEVPVVRVKSSTGDSVLLEAASLRRLQLGSVRFENVPGRIYDCSDLSAQLGVKIDGVLGFPLFRETVLTLDYEHERIILRATGPELRIPGETIPFSNTDKTPLISVRIGDRTIKALIDSGSDAALSLNPVGMAPKFTVTPTDGPIVGTLAGDRQLLVSRMAEDLHIGGYVVPDPIVDLTDGLSSLGGGILKHFTITFDQEHDQVTFYRAAVDPVATPPLRSTGLSFKKSPLYWRVVGVIPGSPADAANVEVGDLVVRINDEPVFQWELRRYEELIANGDEVKYTFVNGTVEADKDLKIVEVVR